MSTTLPYSNTITRNYSDFYNLTQEIFLAVLIWSARRFRESEEDEMAVNICRMLECRPPEFQQELERAWRSCRRGKVAVVQVSRQLNYYMSKQQPEDAAALMDALQRKQKKSTSRPLYEILQHHRQLWIRINLPTPVLHACTMENLHRNAGILLGIFGCKSISEAMQDYCARKLTGEAQKNNGNFKEPIWEKAISAEYGLAHDYEIGKMLKRKDYTARMPHPRIYAHAVQKGGRRRLTRLEKQVLEQLDSLYGQFTAHDGVKVSEFTCGYLLESPDGRDEINLLLP